MGAKECIRTAIAFSIGCFLSIFVLIRMVIVILKSRGRVSWKRHDMPDCLRDPALGTHNYAHLEHVRLHYVAAGDEDKPLMLMIHGLPEFWFSWRCQIREFKKYYRVVAIDLRGYGESDKPSGISNYGLGELAKDIKQLVPALGYESCVLVGHDWGGAVSWTVAGMYPEVVDKLIVMNCPHPLSFMGYVVTHWAQFKKSWFQFFFSVPFLPELYFCIRDRRMLEVIFNGRVWGTRCKKFSREEVEAYKYAFPTLGSFTGPLNYIRAMPRTVPPPQKKIPAPTLLIWGCKDGAIERGLAPLAEKYTGSLTIKYVEDASHWVQMDCPDVVNTHMREFLRVS
ncbi:epoxide hydrolase 4-like isoform X2 [Haliotis rubra]|uniref:epoxide hydrolase 4-like isoform X2 n=1 Tax=Haliotis rubra TaxID=36100 RepID=UPI001EE564E8|nr:epoxide hydrolase 4-like isoform X2 [Haliotis rubra]